MRDQHILLLIDNSTSIAYVNQKGGTASWKSSNLAVEIWSWCLSRRRPDSSNWHLDLFLFSNLYDEEVGTMRCKPVCSQTQHPAATLFQLQTGSQCRSNRRTSTGLETLKPLCLPSIYSEQESLEQDEVRSSGASSSGNSSMANTDLVSNNPGVEYEEPLHFPRY